MDKTNEIRQLVERFMDGETSIKEEETLYAYFASDEVSDKLKSLRPMFAGFEAMKTDVPAEVELQTRPQSAGKRAKMVLFRYAATAAAVAIIIIGGITYIYNRENICEAYIYNQHTTNQEVVMQEVMTTMQEIGNESEDHVEQLHDIFSETE